MAEKPPLPPKPKPPLPPKPRPNKPNKSSAAAPTAAGAPRPTPPPTKPPPASRPATAAPPPPAFKKPTLAPPPPQVLPLKPPPAHQYRQHPYAPGGGGARKPRPYRQPHPHYRRGGGGCSCRRVCCLATGLALLVLCLALAAACLAYLYYRPRAPSFHLQPLSPVRLRLTNSSSSVSAMDATVGARVVSWNPNERVAFRYGDGEGRVALKDATDGDGGDGDGDDVALGWAAVRGFAQAPRSVAAVAFVATARGVVLDDPAAAARVRERVRRRRQGFRVVVDAHVGVRVGGVSTGMVPLRLICDDGVMSAAAADDGAAGGGGGGPMSKCQVLLFRVRWFSLN